MTIGLRRYTDVDLDLSLALETDPAAMAELGGPREAGAIRRVHPTRVAGEWAMVITKDRQPVGSLFVWDSDGEDEVGWMVLPSHQGRGIASAGLVLLLDRIRAGRAFERLHARPGVSNAASNRLCAKHGFELLGPEDVDYAGRILRCNHWVLTLA